MTKLILACIVMLLPLGLATQASAQITGINCVVSGGAGCTTYLQGTTVPYAYVSASGFHTPGDSGGGEFQQLTCTPTTTGTTSFPTNTTVITDIASTAGIWVGEPVTDSGMALASGTKVAGVSAAGDSITIKPGAGAQITGDTLTFTNSDNGGTIIQDHASHCFYRTDYRGDPHEWGAYGGSGSIDDTAALQNWLGWTPGPWIASIPSSYSTEQALTCPKYTAIQGPANNSHAGSDPTGPLVRIFANPATSAYTGGGPGIVMADLYCRISGIAIDATTVGAFFLSTTGNTGNMSTSVRRCGQND